MKPENKRIGLIGVGLLGGAIAERLLQHGFVVSGFDLDRGRLDALEAMGGPKVMIETKFGEEELEVVPRNRNWGRFTWLP